MREPHFLERVAIKQQPITFTASAVYWHDVMCFMAIGGELPTTRAEIMQRTGRVLLGDIYPPGSAA